MADNERRYDIDWLRIIAIALLLIYHIALVFQPWGYNIGFIQNPETSKTIWTPMTLFNIWRIPLLFFISGMGVCFALRRRNWKQLLMDRVKRILLPLVFGSFFIVPIHIYIFQKYYGEPANYIASVGHLWFLLNICIYISQVIGFAFLDQNYDYKFYNFIRKSLEKPYLVFLFIIPFILEAVLIDPKYFSDYISDGHGFILGMLCFFFGFQFIAIGEKFWLAIDKMKYVSLVIAVSLYLIRLIVHELNSPNFLISLESMSWIFALFGFSYKYLNKPSKILIYLSQSAYPVYIVHMIFIYWASYLILPLNLSVGLKFLFITLGTFVGCFIIYDVFIRRVNFVRPLFGLKFKKK